MHYMNYSCIPATFCISRLGTAGDLLPVWCVRFTVLTAVLLKICLLGDDYMSWKNMMSMWNKQAAFKAVMTSHFNFMV